MLMLRIPFDPLECKDCYRLVSEDDESTDDNHVCWAFGRVLDKRLGLLGWD
jgi:hypothetical protein